MLFRGSGVIILLYIFFEIYILIQIGDSIGGLNLFLEVVATAILGFYIISNFKNSIAQTLQALSKMQIDQQKAVSSNLLSLFGAILLIIPGFISDFFGILFQFSIFSTILKNRFSGNITGGYNYENKFKNFRDEEVNNSNYNRTNKTNQEDIIDVEIIEESESSKPNNTIK